MDPEFTAIVDLLVKILPIAALIVGIGVGGSLLNTWLRIRNGYPLETSWGKPLLPKSDQESVERIKLLTAENAQLRAEIGSIKDRLETIERIVTDRPGRLAQEIDSLSLIKGGQQ